MKRILLTLFIITISILSYCQEYTKFMGISMDSDISVFDKVFRADGMQFITKRNFEKEFVYEYVGMYYDIINCNISISEDKANGNIKDISVLLPVEKNDTITPQYSFAHIYNILSKEYKDISVNEDKKENSCFSLQNYFVSFDKRILLRFVKFDQGDMTDLGYGETRYSPMITYYPLP